MFETLMSGGHEQTRRRLRVDWQVVARHDACFPSWTWAGRRPTRLRQIVRGGHVLGVPRSTIRAREHCSNASQLSSIGMTISRISQLDCYRNDAPTGPVLHRISLVLNGGR